MAETRFGALRELRRDPPPAAVAGITKPQARPKPEAPKAISAPGRMAGKSSSPDFERLTIYVRKDTKKAAARKWEDATGQDMSDLVEHLLAEYLST